MKLPGKIWVWKNLTLDTMYTQKWHGPVPEHVKPYIPESEAERLRERVKQLEGALKKVAWAECPEYMTHPQSVWWIEHVQTIAVKALAGGEEKKS